ncbi:GtrA family protein [Cryobacterium fucosi]|uniref:GtrA/DPMS transmembrane domain-containing protein n=1 Tax=Cryobacterium fucosi TaxID=1259157 RepID=A0A4R9B1C0_9MICO|nr:hypothetical protein E3T48_14435 [Cryobacterium fucosi]
MTPQTPERWGERASIRFLIAGGANTAVTALIVVALSLFLPGWIAFTIAFALGIGISVVLTGRWVFQSHLSPLRAALYSISYLAIYLCGLGALQLLALWGASPLANGATVLVTAPLSFLAGRLIFTNDNRKQVA